jgi:hypothetical protein
VVLHSFRHRKESLLTPSVHANTPGVTPRSRRPALANHRLRIRGKEARDKAKDTADQAPACKPSAREKA